MARRTFRADDAGPDYDCPDPGPVSEEIQGILKESNLDDATVERIIKLVDALEVRANAECQRCINQHIMELEREAIAPGDYGYYRTPGSVDN